MHCPFCESDSQVVDSRSTTDGVRRRRVCNECKRRFTTYERPGSPSLKVVKRSDKTEQFSSDKLFSSLRRVCKHRLKDVDIQPIVRSIEAKLVDSGAKSVRSSQIVRLALDRLDAVDPVCRARLAANYIDEDGQLRLEQSSETDDDAQLGLFED